MKLWSVKLIKEFAQTFLCNSLHTKNKRQNLPNICFDCFAHLPAGLRYNLTALLPLLKYHLDYHAYMSKMLTLVIAHILRPSIKIKKTNLLINHLFYLNLCSNMHVK